MDQALLDNLLRSARTAAKGALSQGFRFHHMGLTGRCLAEAACWASDSGCIVVSDGRMRFTLMSAIKPFLLLHHLQTQGAEAVDSWVDDLPSSRPFWSLEELLEDGRRPRNAMINSGAMLLASKLPGSHPLEQQAAFLGWLATFCPGVALAVDEACLAEVMEPDSDPHNMALAEELAAAGRLPDARQAYEIYFRLCCLSGTITDVARLGLALAHAPAASRGRVLHTMSRCGLYEASADWSEATGLPAKSGVSGVMFGVWHGQGCLAACGEWLDELGNPVVPQLLLAQAARRMPRIDP